MRDAAWLSETEAASATNPGRAASVSFDVTRSSRDNVSDAATKMVPAINKPPRSHRAGPCRSCRSELLMWRAISAICVTASASAKPAATHRSRACDSESRFAGRAAKSRKNTPPKRQRLQRKRQRPQQEREQIEVANEPDQVGSSVP